MQLRETGTARPARRATRRFTFVSLLLLAVAAPAGFVMAEGSTRPYIVVFDDDAVSSTNALTSTVLRRDATDKTGHRRIDGHKVGRQVVALQARLRIRTENVYASTVGGFSAFLSPGQVRALERNPAVAAVIPDEEIQLEHGVGGAADTAGSGVRTTANTRGAVPAGIRRVGAQRSTLARVDGRDTRVNVDVAILDTGIDRNHPDLNVAGGYNCTGRNRNKWDDDDGHGTHVAGIVGALDNRFGVVGVAPGARLWSVKVLNSNGRGMLSWMVCGVDWVTSQRDRDNDRARIEVANMSISFGLGSRERDCGRENRDNLHEAICRSVKRGTVYAVAAGNESRDAKRNRPAAYDEVLTVSALADYDGRGGGRGVSRDSCPFWSPERDDSFTTFSNYGADVDLIAPGRCVLSTWPNNRYAWLSGTSMASPHVAGAAAVYRAMYPRATPQQTRLALLAVATRDWRTQTDPDGNPEKVVWIGEFRTMPDFSMSARSATSARTLTPGSALPVAVTLTRTGGFEDAVSVDLADAPAGISAAPLTTNEATAVLDVQLARGITPGTYTITVRAVSGDVERTATLSVSVQAGPAAAEFDTPPAGTLSFDVTGAVTVAWTELAGTDAVTTRTLIRQSGRVDAAGTCAGVQWVPDYSRTRTSPATDFVASGRCYRWSMTLTDTSGRSSTASSGELLVDRSAPRAPSVTLATPVRAALDLSDVGIDATYLGHSGTLWVRGGATGSADLSVGAFDPESGISSNEAVVDSRAGWRTSWLGDSRDGALRLTWTAGARTTELAVIATNGAGLASDATVGRLVPDATAPSPVSWRSLPTDAVFTSSGKAVQLTWTGGSDAESGLASHHWLVRYRAPLNDTGACKESAWAQDGDPQLRANGSTEADLATGACYVWGVRTLDNVGNAAPLAWSAFVIVPRSR